MKICSKCKNEYSDDFFEKNRNQCKNCMREIRRKIMKLYRSEYTKEDRIVISKKQAEWYIVNKEKVKLIQKEYQRSRKENDFAFKLRTNISTLISRVLKRSGSSKDNNSCLLFLPYTLKELVFHLEKQFESWMSWDNYGKYNSESWSDSDSNTWTWNLDHIIPQSDLPYTSMEEENFKRCWSLDNLRPLSAKQNYLDGIMKVRHIK